MTTQEFSNNWDVKLQAYILKTGFGLANTNVQFDEYEKSVFLTEAQEEMVKELYNNTFEGKEELREYLKELLITKELDVKNNEVILPDNVLFIVHENVKLQGDNICNPDAWKDVEVVKYNDLNRIKDNPFRGPSENRALRLDTGKNTAQIINDNTVIKYKVTYLKEPTPIVLVDLQNEGLSIKGVNSISECELDPAIHGIMLDTAIKMAIQSRAIIK